MLFTDQQVYFKCSESIWTEEIALETRRISKSEKARKRKYAWKPNGMDAERRGIWQHMRSQTLVLGSENFMDQWGYLGSFPLYAAAVQEYTSRKLSDHRDILFAINGVLRTLEPTGRIVEGLPESYFLDSLIWFLEIGTINRRVESDTPSWTWAGWKFIESRAMYDLMDVRALVGMLPFLNIIDINDFIESLIDGKFKAESTSLDHYTVFSNALCNLEPCARWLQRTEDFPVKGIAYYSRLDKQSLPVRTLTDNIKMTQTPKNIMHTMLGAPSQDPPSADTSEALSTPPKWLKLDKPYLVIKTVIVEYRIRKAIESILCEDLDQVGLFELIDGQNRCIGEVYTTHGMAKSLGRKGIDFLVATQGFDLKGANLDDVFVPRWDRTIEQDEETRKLHLGMSSIFGARSG